jgi:hypothetical protein
MDQPDSSLIVEDSPQPSRDFGVRPDARVEHDHRLKIL